MSTYGGDNVDEKFGTPSFPVFRDAERRSPLHAAEPLLRQPRPTSAGAPSFDQSISQFRETFNKTNPTLPLDEFRAIDGARDTQT